MCLGIPGKVIEIRDEGGLRMGRVDFGGVRKEACLAYQPDVELGRLRRSSTWASPSAGSTRRRPCGRWRCSSPWAT